MGIVAAVYIVSTARVPSLRSAPWPSIPLFRFSGLNWLHGSVKHVPQRSSSSQFNVYSSCAKSPPQVLLPWGVEKTRLEIPQCLRPPTPLAFFPDVATKFAALFPLAPKGGERGKKEEKHVRQDVLLAAYIKKGFSPEGFCHAQVLRLDNINSHVQRKIFLLSRRPLQCLKAKYFSFLADGKMRRGQFYFCPHFQRGNLANTFDHNTIDQKRNQYGAKSCTYNRSATCCYTLSRRTLVFCTTPFLIPPFPLFRNPPRGQREQEEEEALPNI